MKFWALIDLVSIINHPPNAIPGTILDALSSAFNEIIVCIVGLIYFSLFIASFIVISTMLPHF
jgi:hypothetical protein